MNRSPRSLLLGLGALVLVALVLALTSRSTEPEPDADETKTETTTTTTTTTTTSTTTPPNRDTPTTTTAPTPEQVASELAAELVRDMSTEEVARQLIVTGLTGVDIRGRLRDVVGGSCMGGVFVTDTNTNWQPADDHEAARVAIRGVQDSAILDLCTSQPLVMTDAELGSVRRVPVDPAPGTRTYSDGFGAAEQYTVLSRLGRDALTYAESLRDLGIDVNFGTVADVDLDPGYFMARSGRTFGDEPATVASMAQTVAAAHCTAGVAPTLKHFPNQGATPEDPHREISTAAGGVETWRETGRLPYSATDAPLVMTGHIFLDDLDGERPASMSHAITTGLLREELGYTGLIITDDLSNMRGASDVIADPGQRAVEARRAGATMVLFVDDRDVQAVVDAIVQAMVDDADFARAARVDAHAVLRLKALMGRIPSLPEPGILAC